MTDQQPEIKVSVNLQASLAAGNYPFNESIGTSWLKTVTGLDKSKTNGYSLLGSFVQNWDEEVEQPIGLYLIKDYPDPPPDIAKYVEPPHGPFYSLFELQLNGSCNVLVTKLLPTKLWAKRLWPPIDAWLRQLTMSDPMKKRYLEAERDDLKLKIHAINQELERLEKLPLPGACVLGGQGKPWAYPKISTDD